LKVSSRLSSEDPNRTSEIIKKLLERISNELGQ
jgi:hypothetical protein